MKRHPIQPIVKDEHGVARFKANAIVRHLLDAGPFDMNTLAGMEFSREDREQFAQLIGYSLDGFGELSYVSDDTFNAAILMHETGASEKDALIASLEETLAAVRAGLRDAAAAAFQIHPDNLVA
jgi:hypothetical protein